MARLRWDCPSPDVVILVRVCKPSCGDAVVAAVVVLVVVGVVVPGVVPHARVSLNALSRKAAEGSKEEDQPTMHRGRRGGGEVKGAAVTAAHGATGLGGGSL